jgi:3-methylcrotonyl-CoA carboxylase alpha subunit
MAAAGVPVTPGYLGESQAPEVLAREAEAIGWPVLIKAVAGGGGKGMRSVRRPEDFAAALAGARREAAGAFGDDRVLLEKLIAKPRHIEVQVFRDSRGSAAHMFERDCSLQRRHQKVIEEAPAPGMDEVTRASLCGAAIRAAHAVDYQGAGTVEFIADATEGLRADRIWFMEMNTRLQVEHPVTEAITGLDLVEWQLRIASGEPLPLPQERISMRGHAMEARLYAEDPARGFLPSVGRLRHLRLPEKVRVDSGVEQGAEVTPFYDAMIAKLIVHQSTRAEAAAQLAEAAGAVEVWPVRTNAAFLARCAGHPVFQSGNADTGFIDTLLEALVTSPSPPRPPPAVVARLALPVEARGEEGPWPPRAGLAGFRLNGPPNTAVQVYLDGVPVEAEFDFAAPGPPPILDGDDAIIFSEGAPWRLSLTGAKAAEAVAPQGGAVITPMPGRIVAAPVTLGEAVAVGQVLVILEAMKMEHTLVAPCDGRLAALSVKVGDQVAEGVTVARIEG